jgi:ATP-binding cassette, subfamily B, bacterial
MVTVTPPLHDDMDIDPRRLLGETFRLIARYVSWQRTSSLLAMIGSVSFAATIVVSAQVVGWVAERLIFPVLTGEGEVRITLGGAATAILLVATWKALSIVLRRSGATWWQYRCEQQLRREMVAHQLGLSLRWYASRGVGDLLSVSGTDTKQATRLLAPLPFSVGVVFLLIGSMTLVLRIDVLLGVLAGATLVLVIAIDGLGSWRAFRRMELVQNRRGDLATIAHESFDGALTVRALGREREESQRFGSVADGLRDAIVDLGRTWTGFRAVTELGPTLGTIGILYVATLRAGEGVVSPGDLVTVAYLLSLLVVPTRLIGYLVWDSAQSLAGWRRVERVLEVDDRVVYGTVAGPSVSAAGARVTLEGVTFAYDEGAPILAGVDLELEPGRTFAIVGPTGSGKSTLARLLARLWDPDEGRILLDGIDLREFAPGVVAAHVAYVPQEPFLFDDTVAGNISLGDPAITRADVERAVALAHLGDVVAGLADGLDTRIGERGTTLSGGQQQRLGLARALARSPRLLILDDATSAIDAAVEADILEGLRTAELPATVVVVAARTSTIVLADEVVHVAQGKVVDRGEHAVLVRRSPSYAQLVEAYARDAQRRTSTARGGALPLPDTGPDPDTVSDRDRTAERREVQP